MNHPWFPWRVFAFPAIHPLRLLLLLPPPSRQAYLASDTEGESEEDEGGPAGEEDEEAIRERYCRLLLGGGEAEERHGRKDWGPGGSEDEDGGSEGGSEGEELQGAQTEGPKGRTKVADDKGQGLACHRGPCLAGGLVLLDMHLQPGVAGVVPPLLCTTALPAPHASSH